MSTVVMRQTSEGDFSPCAAAEENVGKRRCNHLPGDSNKFEVQINKIDGRVKEVVISEDYNELDKRDKVTVVKKFVSTLEPISKKDLDLVLKELRAMN